MIKESICISGSLHGPGLVNITVMSLDGPWSGGEAVFEYIDDPPTEEEFLNKVVTDPDMWYKVFERMHKKMSSNKPSDGQTSSSSGRTGPGKLFYYNYANLTSVIVPKN